MNKVLLVVVMLLLAGSTTFAGGKDNIWSEMVAHGDLKASQVVKQGGADMLKITNTTDRELRFEVFAGDKAIITESSYAISGEVEYKGVQGHAYLEMLSYFPPPNTGPFFSRTLSSSGLTGWLTGTGHKRFEVPFFLRKGDPKPIKLGFYVVLPGRGTVYLGPIKLVQGGLESPQEQNVRLGRMGGTLGGIFGGFGGLVGILGAIIGILAGKGKARTFVLGTVKALIGTAVLLLIAGIVLIMTGTWWVLCLPFFFMGLLLLAIMAPMLPMIRQRYDQLELRRISAQDAMG